MKTLIPLAAAALIAAALPAVAQTGTADETVQLPAAPEAKVDTPTFVKAVPAANAFEIRSSAIALKKAASADVKAFAAKMIEDHTQAGKDFEAALDRVETTASVKPDARPLLPKDQALLDELDGLDGADFEARYIALQTVAHQEAVALFTAYARSGDDPALKEFAKKTLPVLTMHERHVKELAAAHQG